VRGLKDGHEIAFRPPVPRDADARGSRRIFLQDRLDRLADFPCGLHGKVSSISRSSTPNSLLPSRATEPSREASTSTPRPPPANPSGNMGDEAIGGQAEDAIHVREMGRAAAMDHSAGSYWQLLAAEGSQAIF